MSDKKKKKLSGENLKNVIGGVGGSASQTDGGQQASREQISGRDATSQPSSDSSGPNWVASNAGQFDQATMGGIGGMGASATSAGGHQQASREQLSGRDATSQPDSGSSGPDVTATSAGQMDPATMGGIGGAGVSATSAGGHQQASREQLSGRDATSQPTADDSGSSGPIVSSGGQMDPATMGGIGGMGATSAGGHQQADRQQIGSRDATGFPDRSIDDGPVGGGPIVSSGGQLDPATMGGIGGMGATSAGGHQQASRQQRSADDASVLPGDPDEPDQAGDATLREPLPPV